jgi:hypothetical protein
MVRRMERFLGFTQTEWTGIYSLLTLGLLIAAVWAAIYAFIQWRETRSAHREETRPYVIVTVDPSPASPQLFDLVVRNIGKRPAKDVTIKLDPPPIRANEVEGLEMQNIKMLNESVKMIAPDQELRAHYDNAIERRSKDDLPTMHTVSLVYLDNSGEKYEETSVLDLDALKGTMFTTVYTVHNIGKSMKSIEETLKKSSVLQSKGWIASDVSVENRSDKELREASDEYEARLRHADLVARLGFRDEASEIVGQPAQDQET